MATDLEELIQYWKDKLVGLPGQFSSFRRQKIKRTIKYLEELKRTWEVK